MGYYSRFSGSLDFNRDLTYAEIQAMPEQDCVKLDTWEDEEPTESGIAVTIGAGSIVPAYEDSIKGYEILHEIQALVDALPRDVKVSGAILGEGEEAGDVRRYVVHEEGPRSAQFVVEERARLLWPDGTEHPGRR